MGSIADLAQKIKLNAGVSNPRLAQIAASAAHAGRSNHYTRGPPFVFVTEVVIKAQGIHEQYHRLISQIVWF